MARGAWHARASSFLQDALGCCDAGCCQPRVPGCPDSGGCPLRWVARAAVAAPMLQLVMASVITAAAIAVGGRAGSPPRGPGPPPTPAAGDGLELASCTPSTRSVALWEDPGVNGAAEPFQLRLVAGSSNAGTDEGGSAARLCVEAVGAAASRPPRGAGGGLSRLELQPCGNSSRPPLAQQWTTGMSGGINAWDIHGFAGTRQQRQYAAPAATCPCVGTGMRTAGSPLLCQVCNGTSLNQKWDLLVGHTPDALRPSDGGLDPSKLCLVPAHSSAGRSRPLAPAAGPVASSARCPHLEPPGTGAFRTGDLVFVRPQLDPRHSSLDSAILATGAATIDWLRSEGVHVRSNETATHVALAIRNTTTGCLSFVQAVPPVVVITSAMDFWHSTLPTTTFYRAWFRDGARQTQLAGAALAAAMGQIGKPYAHDFEPPPAEFYCSSLVEWCYLAASSGRHVFLPVGIASDPTAILATRRIIPEERDSVDCRCARELHERECSIR